MSLIGRKPRPLSRDTGVFRDSRLFIIACDDTFAPKQYFDLFRIPRIQIHVVETTDGTSAAEHVLNRLLQIDCEEDDERWLLLDIDHYARGRHLPSFTSVIAKARRQGIQIAFSRPCFELWLLLHRIDESNVVGLSSAREVEQRLRSELGGYRKNRLNGRHFPAESVVEACLRAERLDASVGGGDIPNENTTRVYKIWRSVAARALPTQLPDAFRSLLPGSGAGSFGR